MIKACDKALADQHLTIDKLGVSLEAHKTELDRVSTELIQEKEDSASIWRNPFVLIGVGVLGGFLLAK